MAKATHIRERHVSLRHVSFRIASAETGTSGDLSPVSPRVYHPGKCSAMPGITGVGDFAFEVHGDPIKASMARRIGSSNVGHALMILTKSGQSWGFRSKMHRFFAALKESRRPKPLPALEFTLFVSSPFGGIPSFCMVLFEAAPFCKKPGFSGLFAFLEQPTIFCQGKSPSEQFDRLHR